VNTHHPREIAGSYIKRLYLCTRQNVNSIIEFSLCPLSVTLRLLLLHLGTWNRGSCPLLHYDRTSLRPSTVSSHICSIYVSQAKTSMITDHFAEMRATISFVLRQAKQTLVEQHNRHRLRSRNNFERIANTSRDIPRRLTDKDYDPPG
jgi:hypothetical protein